MSLNILGGTYKGYTLRVPPGDFIRPTSVMLRRKIFDSHQDMSDFTFIDLCAGSGAMGLEALSRGALGIVLVEKHPKVYKLILENCKKFASENIRIVNQGAMEWLKYFKASYQGLADIQKRQTVLFLDPPYENHEVYEQIINLIEESDWFCGELWLESDEKKGLGQEKLPLFRGKLQKAYVQGSNYVAIITYEK